ncbi:DUF4345 domain-containing protein [Flavobacterium sp. I3-2]|uniref:DUF4345 domain-containing protein n=1 Tax=Flavobacterium sp. I3-2 TaxID=2748319 RepID=UPI0015B1D4AF
MIISSLIVIIVGLAYGIAPNKLFPELFGIKVEGLELLNILRAIMSLYIAFGLFLILGVIKTQYWKIATIVSIIFTAGIAFGRLISFLFDGISLLFVFAFFTEIIIMFWGIYN